jgi:hypothetical protein
MLHARDAGAIKHASYEMRRDQKHGIIVLTSPQRESSFKLFFADRSCVAGGKDLPWENRVAVAHGIFDGNAFRYPNSPLTKSGLADSLLS